MDPSRKRKIRLFVALSVAVLLAGALMYTSFSAGTEAKEPSQLTAASTGNYKLTGKVVPGSIRNEGATLKFRIRDRQGTASVPVTYSGIVPDPFRDGREVIVRGSMKSGRFEAERDSLVTKCPSKFENDPNGSKL